MTNSALVRVPPRFARTVLIRLYQRVRKHLYKVAALPEEGCHALKNMADPLFFVCLTNQHTLSGEIVGNGLVLSLLEQKRSGDERNIIEFCLADRSRRFAYLYMVGK